MLRRCFPVGHARHRLLRLGMEHNAGPRTAAELHAENFGVDLSPPPAAT